MHVMCFLRCSGGELLFTALTAESGSSLCEQLPDLWATIADPITKMLSEAALTSLTDAGEVEVRRSQAMTE